MSKGNMLLGHARGKVGSLVFSRANGKQIVRSRAEVVKNPQTETQMIQRIILNTISQAYSKMAVIADHSFEGVQKGQQSMSFFMRKNMDALREKVATAIAAGNQYGSIYAFTPIKSNIFVVNDYLIAKGTLPAISVEQAESASAMKVAVAGGTYAEVLDKYGLQRGDQLTFIALSGADIANLQFKYARVILDPTNADGTAASLNVQMVSANEIQLPNPRNEGEFGTLAVADGFLSFDFGDAVMGGAAIIVSRKSTDGQTWKRSNATLIANASAPATMFSLGYALDLFQSGGIESLSSLYLNNAGTGAIGQNGTAVNDAKIVSATIDGEAIARGAAIVKDWSSDDEPVFNVAADITNRKEGKVYKLGYQNETSGLQLGEEITGTSGTLTISYNFARNHVCDLVLCADGVVVDTYCTIQGRG